MARLGSQTIDNVTVGSSRARAVVWTYDRTDSVYLSVSPHCEELLGYQRDAWLAPGFRTKRVHPDDQAEDPSYTRSAEARRVGDVAEYRMLHSDGHVVWVRDVMTDVADEAGRIVGGLLIDITEVKRKAEHFDAVFHLLRDLFFRIDRHGTIIECAAPDDRDFYVPPAEFLGKRMEAVLPPDATAVLREGIAQACSTGRMVTGEYSLRVDGAETEWEARFLPLSDSETAVICRDVTVRKQQEREILRQRDDLDQALVELKASEERFRSVIERAPIGMHLYDVSNGSMVLTSANPAADKVLGIDHAPLIGERASAAFPGTAHWDEVCPALQSIGGEWRAEIPYSDDTIKGVFDVSAFETIPGQIALMFMDITERKAIEQADREHNRRVSALAAQIASAEDNERRRLAEELHDRVSQPLAVARMRLRSAADSFSSDSPEARLAVEMLEQAIAETRTITTELYPPVLRELGLAAALGWLADDLCRVHGLHCETHFTDTAVDLPEEIQSFLFRAARELLMNVVKHGGTDRVWLSLDRLGDEIALTVADEGRGFDPAANDASSADMGFGLFSIAERIRYLGGSVDVESAPGEGARITITVPVGRLASAARL